MRALVAILVVFLAFPATAKNARVANLAHTKPKAASTCKLDYARELQAARQISAKAGWGLYPIEGGDVAKFLQVFNAAEPKTDFRAERILIAVNPKFAYFELFTGGCVSHEGRLEPAAFEQLMGEAFGGEIPGATSV